MSTEIRTATKEATRLTKILDVFHQTHGGDRYPVNVEKLALDCASLFQWKDPIAEVRGANIAGFDGGLFKDSDSDRWLLLYNPAVDPAGRIRFTQAHELGHYILHRQIKNVFECSEEDMLNWDPKKIDIESQADKFASHLLMPLHDFRSQTTNTVDLGFLGHCADRYGVSLTAAILKWLEHTDQKAVVIHSRDGYMNWSWSSQPARKAGAFFKTSGPPVPVPDGSLASNTSVRHEKVGLPIAAQVWFEHADKSMPLREMKLSSERYNNVLSLLILPRYAEVWRPRK
ncbi:ImmA/IrrE family metallo-endopeptidase [Propionivibrio dicarboxylicus]|uniref:IrrE N-terminal-like domain-containing protein n=1 Tax=Propionivibrio dicarboxylicus TaxID=83767 RepID=A0A1G8EN36_9RHOO|nr:ImmA/IrrE family metallo-endopeptidase [Propionivibrio dicarboxylicus]SDH71262.1 protein of unknown function [Propionivibrio dicarboxylicus]